MNGKSLRFPILFALLVLTASAAWAGNAKVQVCHVPPGNPGNFHAPVAVVCPTAVIRSSR